MNSNVLVSELDVIQNRIMAVVDKLGDAVEALINRANRTFGNGGDLVRSPQDPSSVPLAPPETFTLARIHQSLDRLHLKLDELEHVTGRFQSL